MATTTPLSEAPFIAALQALNDSNEMLCDFWISELCGDGATLLPEQLTERNLRLIEHDVMQQLSINGTLR